MTNLRNITSRHVQHRNKITVNAVTRVGGIFQVMERIFLTVVKKLNRHRLILHVRIHRNRHHITPQIHRNRHHILLQILLTQLTHRRPSRPTPLRHRRQPSRPTFLLHHRPHPQQSPNPKSASTWRILSLMHVTQSSHWVVTRKNFLLTM